MGKRMLRSNEICQPVINRLRTDDKIQQFPLQVKYFLKNRHQIGCQQVLQQKFKCRGNHRQILKIMQKLAHQDVFSSSLQENPEKIELQEQQENFSIGFLPKFNLEMEDARMAVPMIIQEGNPQSLSMIKEEMEQMQGQSAKERDGLNGVTDREIPGEEEYQDLDRFVEYE